MDFIRVILETNLFFPLKQHLLPIFHYLLMTTFSNLTVLIKNNDFLLLFYLFLPSFLILSRFWWLFVNHLRVFGVHRRLHLIRSRPPHPPPKCGRLGVCRPPPKQSLATFGHHSIVKKDKFIRERVIGELGA